jgi:diguanylate cyclase (GGDEF)-like protein
MSSEGNMREPPVEALDAAESGWILQALCLTGQATYHWRLGSDRLEWSPNASEVLGGAPAEMIGSGRGYASLLDPENLTSRYEAIICSPSQDEGEGVAFEVEYSLRPRGRSTPVLIWVEDSGRWVAGPDGRPQEVFGVVRQINKRHERDERLKLRERSDPLTGVMNRARLAEALGETISAAKREGGGGAFFIAQISNLSVVNDAYGFDTADEVIEAVARRLKGVMRTGDAVGRYSGGKFGLTVSPTAESDLEAVAERFLSVARSELIETARGPVWAMLSIGGVFLPKYADSSNLAMARAEEALALAQQLPTDGFVAFTPSAEKASERSRNAQCASDIVSGLNGDRFTLAYQPIIDAATGEVSMHEGLLRLRLPEGGQIAAVHLIPTAERLGLVRLIDRRAITLAVETLARLPEARLTINVSGITAKDPRWTGELIHILAEHQYVASRLTIEIAESAVLQDLSGIVRFTSEVKALGCSVAIDDFGSGFSCFRNLKVLDADLVKLDGWLSENLSDSHDTQHFVRSLIELAKKFELMTVAERVQSKEDAELLRIWGIDYLQGDAFGEAQDEIKGSEAELPQALPENRADSKAEGLPQTMEKPSRAKSEQDRDTDFSRLRMAISALDAQFGEVRARRQA